MKEKEKPQEAPARTLEAINNNIDFSNINTHRASKIKKSDKEFYDFLAFAVVEWSKTHIVLTHPKLIEMFGEVQELKGE